MISIPAGMSEMPIIKFIIYTIFGSLIWNTILVLVGAFAGDYVDYIIGIIDNASHIILILLVIIISVFVYKFFEYKKGNG